MSAEQTGPRVPYPTVPADLPGVFLSPAPPSDFDPNNATHESLIRNGVTWRRPNEGDHEGLRAAWDRAFSRRWRGEDRLVPRFQTRAGRTHRLRNQRRSIEGRYTNDNWAGTVVQGRWLSATASWVVPEVSRPVGSPEHVLYSSASWVGLDGYDTADGLQAGVGQDVEPDGKISYYAWFEWFAPPEPNSPSYIYSTTITNFLVNPGQTVYCLVQYLTNHTGGYVYFANNDTGEHFSMTLNPPPGAAFTGDTANWIMESVDEPPAALPKFTTLEFTSAWCCGEHSSTGSPGGVGGAGVGVTPVNIGIPGPDNTSNPLTDVVSGVGTVTITYEGP